MNKVDILLLVILGFELVRGFMRGLIIEMASLLIIVVGVYGAIHFSFFMVRLLGKLIPSDRRTIRVVAFGITLIVLMLAAMFLAKVLTEILRVTELRFLSRLAGALFGALEAAIIVGSLFVFLERIFQIEKWLSPSALSKSVLYEPVRSINVVVYANVF